MIHSCRCFLHLQRTELHRTDSFDPEYIKQKTLTPQFLRGKLTAVPVNLSLKIPKMVLKEHFLKIPNHYDNSATAMTLIRVLFGTLGNDS